MCMQLFGETKKQTSLELQSLRKKVQLSREADDDWVVVEQNNPPLSNNPPAWLNETEHRSPTLQKMQTKPSTTGSSLPDTQQEPCSP